MKELDKAITALEEAKAKIDAMLAQNNGLKTADDAQNNGKRWFFDLVLLKAVTLKTETNARMFFSDGSSCGKESHGFYIEVQKSDLPYLEKPEGEWVFKKPEDDDIFLSGTTYNSGYGNKYSFDADLCNVADMAGWLQGYRWVKTPEVAPDVTPEENSAWDGHLEGVLEDGDVNVNVNCWDGHSYRRMATWEEVCKVNKDGNLQIKPDGLTLDFSHKKEVESPDGRFVEYPIENINGIWLCETPITCSMPLSDAVDVVGFGGVQFEGDAFYSRELCSASDNVNSDGTRIPATPKTARFWIKTPTLNDK